MNKEMGSGWTAVASYCFHEPYYILWICEAYRRNPVEIRETYITLQHKAKHRINYSEMYFMFMVPCIIIYSYKITNRCSYMQSILFHYQVHSICFWCFTHPSSGVQFLTVSTATATNHSLVSATYSQRGLELTEQQWNKIDCIQLYLFVIS